VRICELNLRALDGPMLQQASRDLNAMSTGGSTMVRFPRAAVWTCAIFLAMAFVGVGISKLEGPSAVRWTERFAHWGYPANARHVIGVLEILGGLGVLIPRWRRAAAVILGVLMTGALCTHAVHAEFPRLIPPLVLGGLAFLLYSSRPSAGGEQTPQRRTDV
jgi:putative oxidoreductase